MSRKDYEALAAAIRDEYRLWDLDDTATTAIENVAENIAKALQADNPRFNREKFLHVALS